MGICVFPHDSDKTASGLNVEVGMCAAPNNIPFDSICVIPELNM